MCCRADSVKLCAIVCIKAQALVVSLLQLMLNSGWKIHCSSSLLTTAECHLHSVRSECRSLGGRSGADWGSVCGAVPVLADCGPCHCGAAETAGLCGVPIGDGHPALRGQLGQYRYMSMYIIMYIIQHSWMWPIVCLYMRIQCSERYLATINIV